MSQKPPEWPCNSNGSLDDRDFPPLMCHPLQSSLRCVSVAKAYRAKSKSSLAVPAGRIGIQPCFHSSLVETFGRLHSPPTSASACLSFPVTAEKVKRRLHFVNERNNAPSHTLVQGHSGAIDTPAETLRVSTGIPDLHPVLVNANRAVFSPEYLRDAYT